MRVQPRAWGGKLHSGVRAGKLAGEHLHPARHSPWQIWKDFFSMKKPKSPLWSYVDSKAQVLQGIWLPVRMISKIKASDHLDLRNIQEAGLMLILLRLIQSWKLIWALWIFLNLFFIHLYKHSERSDHLVMDHNLTTLEAPQRSQRGGHSGLKSSAPHCLWKEQQKGHRYLKQSRKPMVYFQHLFHRIIATNQK